MVDTLHSVQTSITGHCGRLEGRLYYGTQADKGFGMIICPPHPLLAGNMDNNVVQAVARTAAEHMPVLMFNYPAVGKSSSPRPGIPLFEVWNDLDRKKEYKGIVREVGLVIEWSKNYFPHYHMVGYSFGACMALAALTAEALSYIAIAPPLAEEDFSPLSMLTLPLCCIRAQDDSLLSAQRPENKYPHLSTLEIPGADHFFRGKEEDVAQRVVAFITP